MTFQGARALPEAGGRPSGRQGLRVTNAAKAFGGTRALVGADLYVAPGQIHALVGGNGSGKSTLIKILAGVHQGDAGELEVDGVATQASRVTPGWARAAGLGFVHQDLGLFPGMSVAENLITGLPYPRRHGRIDWRRLRRQTGEILSGLGIEIDPARPLAALRPAEQTLVAIARAVRHRDELRTGVLVLDEPTARLAAPEVRQLFRSLRALAARGQSILYVSHRLEEILELSDELTVLRDGRVVDSRPTSSVNYGQLAALVAGRNLRPTTDSKRASPAEAGSLAPALEVSGLVAGPLQGIDLTVGTGEIVGVAGLVGSGRSSLLNAVFGALDHSTGTVRLDGQPVPSGRPDQAIARGIGFVPEDRAHHGAFLNLSLRENFSAGQLDRYRGSGARRWQRLSLAAETEASRHAVRQFSIRCPDTHVPLRMLSGGNQQKVVLARWSGAHVRLLLLDEPTQGVDVAARADIYQQIRAAADAGMSVLLASSDVDELLQLCDRVVVLSAGRLVAEAGPPELSYAWLTDHIQGTIDMREAIGNAGRS